MPPSGSSAHVREIRALRLHAWSDGAVVAIAAAALASGFGQFGAVAALGDVARAFGRLIHGATIADQAGLFGARLRGVVMAIIRLASLGCSPLIGLAGCRFGRRTMLIATLSIGLALTAGFRRPVRILVVRRDLRLVAVRSSSASNTLTQVAAARTDLLARAAHSAVALTAAGYE